MITNLDWFVLFTVLYLKQPPFQPEKLVFLDYPLLSLDRWLLCFCHLNSSVKQSICVTLYYLCFLVTNSASLLANASLSNSFWTLAWMAPLNLQTFSTWMTRITVWLGLLIPSFLNLSSNLNSLNNISPLNKWHLLIKLQCQTLGHLPLLMMDQLLIGVIWIAQALVLLNLKIKVSFWTLVLTPFPTKTPSCSSLFPLTNNTMLDPNLLCKTLN